MGSERLCFRAASCVVRSIFWPLGDYKLAALDFIVLDNLWNTYQPRSYRDNFAVRWGRYLYLMIDVFSLISTTVISIYAHNYFQTYTHWNPKLYLAENFFFKCECLCSTYIIWEECQYSEQIIFSYINSISHCFFFNSGGYEVCEWRRNWVYDGSKVSPGHEDCQPC